LANEFEFIVCCGGDMFCSTVVPINGSFDAVLSYIAGGLVMLGCGGDWKGLTFGGSCGKGDTDLSECFGTSFFFIGDENGSQSSLIFKDVLELVLDVSLTPISPGSLPSTIIFILSSSSSCLTIQVYIDKPLGR
jgi:hypothetical protein